MSVLPSIAPARRRTFTPYVLGYLVSALLALAYLVFLGVRPDVVAMWRDKPDDAQTVLVETQRNVERALADLDPIKQGVGEMKMDVDNMKTGMQEAMERDRLLLQKVETLERNVAQASEKVAAAPAAPKKVAAAATPAAAKPATPAPAKTPAAAAGEEHRDGKHRAAQGRGTGEAGPRRRAARHRALARLAASVLADPQRSPRSDHEAAAAALRRERQGG